MLKIAINGYGRIGRSFVRALAEREAAGNALPVRLVAINDLGRAEDLLYLTRYDTTHGRLNAPAELVDTAQTATRRRGCSASRNRSSCPGRNWAWTWRRSARRLPRPR